MSKIFKPMTMENLVKILDEKEASRLKKLYEEWEKKQAQGGNKQNNSQGQSSGGMMGGFGGMGGMGGMMGGFSNAIGGGMSGRY
jgi:hypothetical protein